MALLQKKATTTVIALWWFCCKEGDNNNVITFFYGGGVVKKVMAVGYCHFFLWSFWSSSLEWTINNEMMIFLNFEGHNGLRKEIEERWW